VNYNNLTNSKSSHGFQVERAGQTPLREVRIAFDIPVKYKKYEFANFKV
jgi:hypothetical protein